LIKTVSARGALTLLDINRIKLLVEMMVNHDLTEISLRDGDVEVNLRRPMPHANDTAGHASNNSPGHNPSAAVVAVPAPAQNSAPPAEAKSDADLATITSPMVGTYYAAADPDSQPFVRTGSRVDTATVVCIIEAMKVFNEIKAEVAGVIERVLVKNQESVEFGQALFLVRPE
jgi:acetyl-CoA carboxylase biotin carboxyl carrier protein